MNSLIILPEECVDTNKVILRGERALDVVARHDLQVGLTLKIGMWGGLLGTGTVNRIESELVEIEVVVSQPSPPTLPLSLVVAVPRPQTIKKVLSYAAMLGIEKIQFIRTDRSQKNYLQSKQLRPEEINREILLGLEQAGATHPPQVSVTLKPILDVLKVEPSWVGNHSVGSIFCADGNSEELLSLPSYELTNRPVTLLIGPELGWSARERLLFSDLGFQMGHLGPRMLRVEVAIAVAVGQMLKSASEGT